MSVAAKPAEGASKNYGQVLDSTATAIVPALAKVLWEIIRRPYISVPVGAVAAIVLLVGPWVLYATTLVLVSVLVFWWWLHERSFMALVGRPARTAFRRFSRYRIRWKRVMRGCGLHQREKDSERFPTAGRIRVGPFTDTMIVRLLPGQDVGDFEKHAASLAAGFNAAECVVREGEPGRVSLTFKTGEPLAEVIPALPIPDLPDERAAESAVMPATTWHGKAKAWLRRRAVGPDPVGIDLAAIPVGLREDGSPWTMQLRGTHTLIAGVTGAGKSGVIWGLLRGVAPMIRDGSLIVWAIDPKSGAELGPGEALFARYADKDLEEMVTLLEDAVIVMRTRAARLKAQGQRLHEPSVDDPHLVLIVDEIANLTAYLGDTKLRTRVTQALGLLLTQGRAPGVTVVGALQDPRVEVLKLRNLFSTKIAMRLDEAEQVRMVLGDGARERGAYCDRIPKSLPGVGYVRLEGQREPERVRAAFVTDEDIAEMVREYQPRERVVGPGKRLDLA